VGRPAASHQFLVHFQLVSGIALVPFDIMADHEHNSSMQPGVARNPDLALNVSREHEHEHVHHSAHAVHHDNSQPVYTTGTTDEKISKLLQPSAQDSHVQHRHVGHDIEKTGGFADYEEKGTRSSSNEPEGEYEKKAWYSPSVLYRKYRLPVHIFIGCLFTG
jgi:CNT family concentrative nucleoside transporter